MAASLVNNAQHRLRRLAREFRFRLNGWTVAAVLLGLFLFLPMAEVLWHITSPAENWEHLRDTVLGRYLKGSAILVVGTAGLSLLLGVSTAWLVACCEFPGRRFFEWALILPLAIPTYIAAFAYFD
ncbi:MAG: iron ABC transporter permease, partial [Limisphaerales bacterium]